MTGLRLGPLSQRRLLFAARPFAQRVAGQHHLPDNFARCQVADRRGYEARDDYDKAAAEEWVCRALKAADCTQEQAAFARRLKELIGQDEYPATSIHDDARFERYVRSHLRKLAKMTKANEGFEKMLRYQ